MFFFLLDLYIYSNLFYFFVCLFSNLLYVLILKVYLFNIVSCNPVNVALSCFEISRHQARIFGAARIERSIEPRQHTYTGSSTDSFFSGAACHRRIGNIFRLSLSLHNTLVSSTARRRVGFPLKWARYLAQLTSFFRHRDTYNRSKIEKRWLLDFGFLTSSCSDI